MRCRFRGTTDGTAIVVKIDVPFRISMNGHLVVANGQRKVRFIHIRGGFAEFTQVAVEGKLKEVRRHKIESSVAPNLRATLILSVAFQALRS